MSALTKNRITLEREGTGFDLPAAASKVFYSGALCARDAFGNATPGATSTTILGVGRVANWVDNSLGAAGAKTVNIDKGIFAFRNSTSTDAITRADIGNDCYIVDDQTVAKTNGTGTRSVAGKVYCVDDFGVWVDMRG